MYEAQNSRDDNLCKSDVQVGIYLKFLLIKLKPAVLLFITDCNFKSLVEEILVSCLFIVSSLKGHSFLKCIRCFARFGSICIILKNVKNTRGGISLLVKLQAYFTKSNTPPRVFTFLILYKWYQIAQRIL